mgnify:CR=1 FL=1
MSDNYSLQETQKSMVSGVNSIQFLPVAGVLNFPDIVSQGLSEMHVELNPGYAWIDIPLLDNSGVYSEEEEETLQGVLYLKKVSCFIPHDQKANRDSLNRLTYVDLIVKYKDRSGNHMILGTPNEPLRIKIGFKVEQLGGTYGYPIHFMGKHTFPAAFLTLPDLPQFSINAEGELVYQGGLEETFILDANGELVVTGTKEARYSLDSKGRVVYS